MVLVTYIKKGSQRHFSYRRPGAWMPKPGSPGGWEGDVRAAGCGSAFWKAAAALRPQRELGPSRCPTRALSWVYQRPRVSLLSHAGAGVRQGRPRFSLVAVSSANGNRRSSNGVGSGMSRRGAPGVTQGSTHLSAQLDQQSVCGLQLSREATLLPGHRTKIKARAGVRVGRQRPASTRRRPAACTERRLRPAHTGSAHGVLLRSAKQTRQFSSSRRPHTPCPRTVRAERARRRVSSGRAEVSLVGGRRTVSHVAPAVVSEAHEQMPSENRTEQSSQQRGFCE